MGGPAARVAVQLTFRAVALALGVGATYAAAGLGPVGLVLLAWFVFRGRRPMARALAHVESRLLPSPV